MGTFWFYNVWALFMKAGKPEFSCLATERLVFMKNSSVDCISFYE